MHDELRSIDVPLVLHVIPTARARGAQREARALADALDSPGTRAHRVLSLFAGSDEVPVDASLDYSGRGSPATGFDPGLPLRLRTTLDRMDPDVVVAHGSEPLKYLAAAMAFHHRPLAYYAIGTYSGPSGGARLGWWRYLMGRADVIAAEGDEVRDECVERMRIRPSRVVVVPNGRDPEVFRPGGTVDSIPQLVFVGALTEGKGPDRFIDLVAALRAEGRALEATIIGDGPLWAGLVEPAEAAGVTMLGSRSDVAELLAGADLVVFPSRPAGEGMPGVLIEAGLCGLAVVATDVPGVRSIVEDGRTGVVVPVDDPTALVAAVSELLGDPGRRAELGRAARQRCCDRFSLAVVAEAWLSILAPLLPAATAGSTAVRTR